MMKLKNGTGGLQAMHIRLLNGRIFQRLLNEEVDSKYSSEQGKILNCLWVSDDGQSTPTNISKETGLTNNTLTTMLKHMEEKKLITLTTDIKDKRKKIVKLTELGWSQEEINKKISKKLDSIFYKGFTKEDIIRFEEYQKKIIINLSYGDEK